MKTPAVNQHIATLLGADELDQRMTGLFWDAEWILREAGRPTYAVYPREPHDEAIAASIGATIVPRLTAPVLVWRNDAEET